MKRIIKSCTVLMICLALFSIPCFAQTYTEGAFYYELEGESITITGYFGREEEITVPENIAGYPVNVIGSGAFANSESVKIIHLPGTITEIQKNAFRPEQQVLYAENHPANRGNTAETVPDNHSGEDYAETVPADSNSDEEPVVIAVGDVSEEDINETNAEDAAHGSGSGGEADFMEDDDEGVSEIEPESSTSEIADSASVVEEEQPAQKSDVSSETSEQTAEKEAATRITNPAVWIGVCAGVAIVVIILVIVMHKKKR